MDTDELVESACREIVEQTQARRSVLVFTTGVQHGGARRRGVAAGWRASRSATVFGETAERGARPGPGGVQGRPDQVPGQRQRADHGLRRARTSTAWPWSGRRSRRASTTRWSGGASGSARARRTAWSWTSAATSCGTGRSMRSGSRRSNIAGSGEAPAKQCPECQSLIAAGYAVCPDCGYEFPPPERRHARGDRVHRGHPLGRGDDHASTRSVTSSTASTRRRARRRMRPGHCGSSTRIGFHQYQSEWICFEHTGWAASQGRVVVAASARTLRCP